MRVGQLLREGRARLAHNPDADWDARELLLHALELPHDGLVRHLADDVPPDAEQRCVGLFERRAQGEPVQYILGEAWFMGLRFSVDARVLIPRQERLSWRKRVVTRLRSTCVRARGRWPCRLKSWADCALRRRTFRRTR